MVLHVLQYLSGHVNLLVFKFSDDWGRVGLELGYFIVAGHLGS